MAFRNGSGTLCYGDFLEKYGWRHGYLLWEAAVGKERVQGWDPVAGGDCAMGWWIWTKVHGTRSQEPWDGRTDHGCFGLSFAKGLEANWIEFCFVCNGWSAEEGDDVSFFHTLPLYIYSFCFYQYPLSLDSPFPKMVFYNIRQYHLDIRLYFFLKNNLLIFPFPPLQNNNINRCPPAPPFQASVFSFLFAARKFFLRYLALPRPYFLRIRRTTENPDPQTGNYYSTAWEGYPYYVKPTFWHRWGPGAMLSRLLGLYMPGDEGGRFYPQGFNIVNVGPRTFEGKGSGQVEKERNALRQTRTGGCPFH